MQSASTTSPWRALLPLGLATALSLPGDATLYVVLPSHHAAAGISIAAVGVILGINRAVRIFLNTPAGMLYDRTGRRRLFLLAMTTGTLSTAIYALSTGFWPLLAGRLLWGLSWALLLVGGYTIVLDVTTVANRGRWMGVFQAFYMLGGAMGAVIGGVLMDVMGYRPTLWICTGLTGLGLAITWIALPETAPRVEGGRPALQWRPSLSAFTSTLRTLRGADFRTQVVNYVNFAMYLVGNGVLYSTLGLVLSQRVDRAGFSLGPVIIGVASLTGLLLAIRSVVGIGTSPIAGWLSDLLGDRWILVAGGCLVIALGFGALAGWEAVTAVVLGVLVVSVGRGLITPGLTALAGDLAPAGRRSLTMGGFATAADLGSASGPMMAYALATRIGLAWVYAGCIGLMISAALLAWMTSKRV